jgi:hypothetical protein
MSRNRVEDLKVFHKSVTAADAIFALTIRVAFNRHLELRNQMLDASGSIQAHFAGRVGAIDRQTLRALRVDCPRER